MPDFKFLKRYERPSHFMDCADFDRREYFVVYGRHRDSDLLTESNWRVMLARLGGESETVLVIRDSHFLVGWVEAIYIHHSDIARCLLADGMLGDIDDYPILDESDYSDLECDRAFDYWSRCSLSERIDWCRRYGVSIFAARHTDDIRSGELLSALAE